MMRAKQPFRTQNHKASELKLLNEYAAHRYLIGVIGKNEELSDHPLYVNKGRHMLIATAKGNRYYCIYHRDWFLTFAKQFPEYVQQHPEHDDVAESLNLESLEKAEKLKADAIIFIHPEGNTYKAYTAFVRKYCVNTHKLVRTQLRANKYLTENYTGEKVQVQEKTVSIPKALLQSYDFL